MNLIKIVKRTWINIFESETKKKALTRVYSKKEDKLDIILNMIESISINNNSIHIKTNENFILENKGHSVLINDGVQVLISEQIHFNPKIDFSDRNMGTLEEKLKDSIK